jgi:hypothetical protein
MTLPEKWVSVDPGEMTGYAIWHEAELVRASALPLWKVVTAVGFDLLRDKANRADDIELTTWDLLVIEDWQLYPWSAVDLSWDKQDTVRGIGALQFAAVALERQYVLQPAKIKEAAKSLGAQELFRRPLHPNRHANDAIMHGVYYAAQAGKGVTEAGD